MRNLKSQKEIEELISQEFTINKIHDYFTLNDDEIFKTLDDTMNNVETILKLITQAYLTTTMKYLSDTLNEYEENKFYGFDHIDYVYGIYSIISNHLSDQ